MHECIFIYVHMFGFTYVHTYVWMYVCVYVCINLYMYEGIDVSIVWKYVYKYVLYVYIFFRYYQHTCTYFIPHMFLCIVILLVSIFLYGSFVYMRIEYCICWLIDWLIVYFTQNFTMGLYIGKQWKWSFVHLMKLCCPISDQNRLIILPSVSGQTAQSKYQSINRFPSCIILQFIFWCGSISTSKLRTSHTCSMVSHRNAFWTCFLW